MIDLHNHTPYCHHAVGDPADYVRRAIALGFREYGFSEHSPWMFQYPGEQLAPTPAEFDSFLADVDALRALFHGEDIRLRLGIEMDFIPSKLDEAARFAGAHPFDYRIGSIHNIGDWMIDHPDRQEGWSERGVDSVFADYFDLMRQLVESGLFDVIGHLDLPKKFGHRPEGGYFQMVEDLIPLIRSSGMVVEVNTAGLFKPVGEVYPAPALVSRLAAAGVPFTVGSDAHHPDHVGRGHAEALRLLRECGVREVLTFEERRRIGLSL